MSDKQNHKRWRKQFNERCLDRDDHKCVFCDKTENLDVHHITNRKEMPNGGYVSSNGITVCDYHHLLCEDWNIAGICEDGFHPDNLYELIKSSYEKAIYDSTNLK